MTDDPLNPDVFAVLNEIGIIDQLARARVERELPHGLKISQFALLNHLVRLGGDWSPTRLANAFQVTKGAMTNTVRRLTDLGFVAVRAANDDGRGKRISITSAGIDAHRDCLHAMEPGMAMLQAHFGAASFSRAKPFLEALRCFLDENR